MQQPKRWKGVLELWEGGNSVPFFVDVTPLAAKEFLDRLAQEPMRGLKVSIQRERKHARAPLRITILDRHTGRMPPAHDPWQTLRVVFGLKN